MVKLMRYEVLLSQGELEHQIVLSLIESDSTYLPPLDQGFLVSLIELNDYDHIHLF